MTRLKAGFNGFNAAVNAKGARPVTGDEDRSQPSPAFWMMFVAGAAAAADDASGGGGSVTGVTVSDGNGVPGTKP